MSNSSEVATAGEEHLPSAPLSDAQLLAFWDGIVANLDAARRMAARFVSPESAEDVAHSAMVLFKESLEDPKKPAPFPASDDQFRRRFLTIVKNYAIDCVRPPVVADRPVHSHWSKAPEPVVGGRKIPDRELDRVFARNDQGEYDAPAPTERRAKDDLDELDHIIRNHLEDLSPTQYDIIVETFYDKRKRAEVAARHGISVSTYDNHLQAAFRTLRASMQGVVDFVSGMDVSPWYDLIEELLERRAAAQPHRGPRKRGERSNTQGERSNVAGERCKVQGKRSKVEGERRNAAHERGKDMRAGAA